MKRSAERLDDARRWLKSRATPVDLVGAYSRRYHVGKTVATDELYSLGYRDDVQIQQYEAQGIRWEYVVEPRSGEVLVVSEGTREDELPLRQWLLALRRRCRIMRERLDSLLRTFQEEPLGKVISHLERFGVTTAFMVGSAAVIKFQSSITPEHPLFAGLIGLVLLLASFVLLTWVAIGGWSMLLEFWGYTWINHIVGAFWLIASLFVAVASVFAAFNV